jgi:putative PIN family toxin of toxin-antitoxin system
MRVLFDTNILIRAAKPGKGPAKEALTTVLERGHVLLLSEFILEEIVRASRYPRLQQAFGFTEEQIETYTAELRRDAVIVDPQTLAVSEQIPVPDPDDEPVLKAAIAGNADLLCTLDNDIRHPDVTAFLATYGVRVQTDVQLLAVLRALHESEDLTSEE